MTTLELARAIADAVLWVAVTDDRALDSTTDAPTKAVLRTLEAHDSWFCRLTEDENGITREKILPRQSELFK